MRSVYLRMLILSLAAIGWVTGQPNASAQTYVVDWNKTWKYWANTNAFTTNNVGSNWTTATFSDTAWPSGAGLFYAETGASGGENLPAAGTYGGNPGYNTGPLNTDYCVSNPNCTDGPYIWTFYFRTHFTYSGPNTTNVVLQLETIYDDGVVYYLNGREIPGTRVNMPAGAVTWSTQANGTREPSDSVSTNTVLITSTNVANLIVGDNMLAAEVHQGGSGSSDIAFGLRLLVRPTLPPTIISNYPSSFFTNVESGTTVVLDVTESGDAPFGFQWRRGTNYSGTKTNISGSPNSATYSFVASPSTLGSNRIGYFDIIVTNAYGRVTSSVFTVQCYVNNLSITQQPTNQVADVGFTNVTMSVRVFGTQPAFQWQTNTLLSGAGTWVNIPGATSSNYNIASVTTNDDRRFRCVITNWNGAITSSIARLTVYPDLTGPALISATVEEETGNAAPYRVTVQFSESVQQPAATAISNYVINLAGTSTLLNITNIQGTSGSSRSLRVDGLKFGSNYVLTVSNVRDTRNNIMPPNSKVGLQFSSTDQLLNYGDPAWWVETHGSAPGWLTNGYDPYANFWGGPNLSGDFYFGVSSSLCAGTIGQEIILGPITYYFISDFVLTNVNPRGTLYFHAVVDDGAIFYLNGAEIGRYNMPAGPVTETTYASSQVGDPVCVTNSLPVTNLRNGTNRVQVELHMGAEPNTVDSDACFGAELFIKSSTMYVVPPQTNSFLFMTRQPNRINLSWTNYGYALQSTRYLTNDTRWDEVQTNMSNPMTIFTTNAGQVFYRIKNRNP